MSPERIDGNVSKKISSRSLTQEIDLFDNLILRADILPKGSLPSFTLERLGNMCVAKAIVPGLGSFATAQTTYFEDAMHSLIEQIYAHICDDHSDRIGAYQASLTKMNSIDALFQSELGEERDDEDIPF